MAEETITIDTDTTSDEDVTGLKKKNADLVKRLKIAETERAKALTDLEEAVETANSEKTDELGKAQRQITKLQNDLKAAIDRADGAERGLRDHRRDHAIAEAIASHNVEAAHAGMLSKAFRIDVEFDDDGEPTIEGKSIKEYAKGYFAKEGKAYTRAPDHSGGGSVGTNSTKAPPKLSKPPVSNDEWTTFDKMDVAERNALADSWGTPELKL